MLLKQVLPLIAPDTWVQIERSGEEGEWGVLFRGTCAAAIGYDRDVMPGNLLLIDKIVPFTKDLRSLTDNYPALRVIVI